MDYANIPVMAPPKGVQSNFDNPKTLKSSMVAINATFLPLMLLAVAIRLYSRGQIMHAMGWDDYTCVLAVLGSVVHTILMLWDIHLGYGTHMWDIRAITLLPSHLRDMTALAVCYPIVIFFVKLTISLLYLRLFGMQKAFRYSVYGGIMFCFLFYTAYMGTQIGTVILCVNTGSTRISLCRNTAILTLISGVVNVVTDLYLLCLPIRSLMLLKMRGRRKFGLLLIFMSGLIACLVSIARLVLVSVRFHDPDTLYNAALTTELTSVELNVGIITASMPAMPQFFGKSKIFKMRTYSSLRLRLFSERSSHKASINTKEAKHSKETFPFGPDTIGQQGNGYLELADANQFRIFKGDASHEEDGSSQNGILRTTDYGVSSAPEPGNFTMRQEIEEP
ncbi:hypothetical protein JMJ35_001064 [Cladonia borealis]|uniref:Rhodopsin domain-containing protein n=1 Tax=Cladonia borealis TaxID=184061 RepID=A0AA39UED0_9LECA|nr:hypothetical protein JMJ35_001064 [Cladonia borealis]